MTIKEIIDGLKFTMDMCLFSPIDGSKRPVSMLNDMDKITYNACEGAIQALEQQRWIPVSERLPKEDGIYLISTCKGCIDTCLFYTDDDGYIWVDYEESVIAWRELPQPYKEVQDADSD